MPYFPTAEQAAYFCPNCRGWFVPGNLSCMVAHTPGSCCHLYERRLPDATVIVTAEPALDGIFHLPARRDS